MFKKVPKQFILFLAISILFWLLITLSKSYKSTINFDVIYTNLPQDKLFAVTPPKSIFIQVKASGFKLIQTNLLQKKIKINVSNLINIKDETYNLNLLAQKTSIENQLLKELEIIDFENPVITLKVSKLATKKVGLISQTTINFLAGYGLVKPLEIVPDSIFISGPKQLLDSINSVPLTNITLNKISRNFSETVAIESVKSANIKFNTKKVVIKGEVDKITEGTIEVDFKVVHKSASVKLTTLVKKVTIVYVVALSDFNKITNKSFLVECDYQLVADENLSYLIPKIVEKPNFVKSVKIIPETIDFLIQK